MKKIIITGALLILSGCATQSEKLAKHGTVIPQPEGFYAATGKHINDDTALKIALASAEQCCIKRQKMHVVYDVKTSKDSTLVDEKVAQTADLISDAVSVAGRYIPGGDILRGQKYAQVTFKCE